MADDVTQLVSDILDEGGFEASQDQALRWLNRRHRQMVSRALGYRKTVVVGTTVLNQQDYAVPTGLIAAIGIDVDGVTYDRLSLRDMAAGARGYLLLSGDGVGTASTADDTGAEFMRLYPAPDTAGKTISLFGAFMPPDLTLGGQVLVDLDMVDPLVDGAIATGLTREGRDDAAVPKEQRFVTACEEYRVRVKERLRTKGPGQIRLMGRNYI